jgi:hypothetical protein
MKRKHRRLYDRFYGGDEVFFLNVGVREQLGSHITGSMTDIPRNMTLLGNSGQHQHKPARIGTDRREIR